MLDAIRNFFVEHQISLAIAVLCFLCWLSYHDARAARPHTTLLKYVRGYVTYFLVVVLIFLFIASFPDLVLQTLQLFGNEVVAAPVLKPLKVWEKSFPTVVALVLMILLVKTVPQARRTHQALLTQMRTFAHIPREVRKLSGRLYRSSYRILVPMEVNGQTVVSNPDHEKQLREVLSEEIKDERDWRLNEQDTLRYDFAKTISMLLKYKCMLKDSAFSYYISIFCDREHELGERCQTLRRKAGHLIGKVREYADRELPSGVRTNEFTGIKKIRRAFGPEIDQLRRELRDFQRAICLEIARALLLCKTTESGRRHAIERLGFDYTPARGDIVSLCCIAMMAMFGLTVVVLPVIHPEPVIPEPVRLFKVFAVMSLAAAIAIMAKSHTHAPRNAGLPPSVQPLGLPAYLLVAAIAASGGFVVSLAVDYLRHDDLMKAFASFSIAPVAMPATFAGVLAYQLDQDPEARKRWKEALTLAMALVLTAWAVMFVWEPILVANGIGTWFGPDPRSVELACVLQLPDGWLSIPRKCVTPMNIAATVFASIVGAILGGLVPDAYFKQRDEVLEELSDEDIVSSQEIGLADRSQPDAGPGRLNAPPTRLPISLRPN